MDLIRSRENAMNELTSPSRYSPPAVNSVAPPPPLTNTWMNLRIRALTLSPSSFPASALTDLNKRLRYMACFDDVARRVSWREA